MDLGIVGIKRGMTRVFDASGDSVAVTVIEAQPNRVTQLKTLERDKYCAVQITAGEAKPAKLNKPQVGHFAKSGADAGRGLWEFRLADDAVDPPELGSELTVAQFIAGQKVDVTGRSIGKGFSGAIKRWNFHSQDNSHGNSISHRALGSVGQCQTPGRVFKGKKMPGQLGNRVTTTQNLEIVKVDVDRNLLLVKGAVAGAKGGDVVVKPAIKAGPQARVENPA